MHRLRWPGGWMGIFAAAVAVQMALLLLPRGVMFQALVYASPVAFAGIALIVGFARVRLRGLILIGGLLVINVVAAVAMGGYVQNVVFSIATYGSAALLLLSLKPAEPGRQLSIYVRWLWYVAGVNFAVGSWQLLSRGFPFRLPYRDYSPDVFAGLYGSGGPRLVTMLFVPALVVAVTMAVERRRPRRYIVPITVFALGVVAPSSNATMLAAVAGVGLYLGFLGVKQLVLARRRAGRVQVPNRLAITLLVVVTVVGSVVFFSIGSVSYLVKSLDRFTQRPEAVVTRSPKLIAAIDTLTVLPREAPLQPAIGVGLGNYSSWSQLIMSGYYPQRFLRGRVGALPVYRSELAEIVLHHIAPESYERFGRFYVESVSTQPWFSWQSLYAETGLLGLVIVALLVLPFLRHLGVRRSDPPYLRAFKHFLGVYTCFVFMLGFIDDYFEYPWLMVPYLLGLLVLSAEDKAVRRTAGQ